MTSKPSHTRTALERTLPRAYYFSDDIFEREKAHIFCREWLCVGREEALPAGGDYLLLDVAGESVLVVRTREGTLRAHYNVCRHRGCRLVLDREAKTSSDESTGPSGTFAGVIRCPYHSWTYNLDGVLRAAPHLDEEDGFYRDEFSLYPVAVESWGGFLFVNLTPTEAGEGKTLSAQLGAVPGRLERYPLAELRTARRIAYRVGANWKVVLENYNECYHCTGVHPELCRVVPAFRHRGGAELDWERGIPHREGAWTFTQSGTTTRRPFEGLSEDERTRHKGELIYPNLLVSLSADHVAAFTLWPHGPERTTVLCDFLFHPTEMAKPGFDASDAVEFWDLVNRQDWTICEGVQQGMRSRVFEFGYYGPMESYSRDIRRYIADRLEAVPSSDGERGA